MTNQSTPKAARVVMGAVLLLLLFSALLCVPLLLWWRVQELPRHTATVLLVGVFTVLFVAWLINRRLTVGLRRQNELQLRLHRGDIYAALLAEIENPEPGQQASGETAAEATQADPALLLWAPPEIVERYFAIKSRAEEDDVPAEQLANFINLLREDLGQTPLRHLNSPSAVERSLVEQVE